MEPEQNIKIHEEVSKFTSLRKVTPFSKYLAMLLFVILPFLGCWVGYQYAPTEQIQVEKLVYIEGQKTEDDNYEWLRIYDSKIGVNFNADKKINYNENNFYVDGEVIFSVQEGSFEIYGKDENGSGSSFDILRLDDHLYCYWLRFDPSIKRVGQIDVETFRYVGQGYAKDKNYVYNCNGTGIISNNPESFEIKTFAWSYNYLDYQPIHEGKYKDEEGKIHIGTYDKKVFYNDDIRVDLPGTISSGEIYLGVSDTKVFYRGRELVGIDVNNFEVANDRSYIADKDTLYNYRNNCHTEFYELGEIEKKGTYVPYGC